MKVWLLTNIPSPYQLELLKRLGDREDCELQVRFMSGKRDLIAKLPGARRMFGFPPAWFRDEIRFHPRVLWEVLFGKFDCFVLSGLSSSLTFNTCALLLTLRRKPWAVWLERPREPNAWTPSALRWKPLRRIKDAIRNSVLRKTRRVIAMGTMAQSAYAAQGISIDKVSSLPYCCNIDRFQSKENRQVTRDRLGLKEDDFVFLYSGQMIQRKGVDTLIHAFEKLCETQSNVKLLLLGDGPLKAELESQTKALPIAKHTQFLGWLAQDDLPDVFSAADTFVFPSRHDGWAVVINEACGAGLPIIATHQTGAVHDLIEEAANGFIVQRDDIDGFYEKMKWLSGNRQAAREFGWESARLVSKYSVDAGASTFMRELNQTIES